MRRAAATGLSLGKMLNMLLSFWGLSLVEHMHPLEGGYLRRKVRTERRPGLGIEPIWRFWPAYIGDALSKHARIAGMAVRLLRLRHQLKRNPEARRYRDLALTPVEEAGTLVLRSGAGAVLPTAGKRPQLLPAEP
jgi:hypothetical protein